MIGDDEWQTLRHEEMGMKVDRDRRWMGMWNEQRSGERVGLIGGWATNSKGLLNESTGVQDPKP